MTKTILITGVAGLIGSHLAIKFLNLGYKVVGIDALYGGYVENMPVGDYNYVFYRKDILNQESMTDIMNKHTPETVIHCAAFPHEGLSVFSPSIITKNIYSGTVSVASAAISAGVEYFINTSSMARYGAIQTPFDERQQGEPQDPYGMAKLQAEQMLNLLHDIHGIKVFHVVPHNVCGPHQCYSDPYRNVMSIFANRILHNRPVYIYGDGLQKRSFSHIYDCIDAFVTLYQKKDELASGNVFNIGPDDGTEISILELAQRVHNELQTPYNIIHIDDRPREVKDAWVSTTKAKNTLNYNTKYTIEDTVKHTVNWIKNSKKRDFDYHLTLEIINSTTPKTWTERLFNDN